MKKVSSTRSLMAVLMTEDRWTFSSFLPQVFLPCKFISPLDCLSLMPAREKEEASVERKPA